MAAIIFQIIFEPANLIINSFTQGENCNC